MLYQSRYTCFGFLFLVLITQTLCHKHRHKHAHVLTIEGKIVGGKPVPIEKFPHMAQLLNGGALCAGTILSSWAIMTAAHCFEFNQDIDDMEIHVGARYTYDSNAEVYDIWYFIIHEDYSKVMPFSCDIALIFVKQPVKFSVKTKKAVIANSDKWMVQGATHFSATGWGWIKYNGPLSSHGLMTTSLRYVPLDKCGQLHNLTMSEDMFCLYGNGKYDTCKGDSGGGVEWNGMVVGIVSHGDGCAQKDKPSVYANVWYLRSWVQKKLFEFQNEFCNKSITDGIRTENSSILRCNIK
ncbi:chymotrypsin-1-like [Cydia fagiglandana]|uniref:chymotrypsin-1-like n=1 Tax=Cydia fagiglandana TaxID=1458189 RepID=UPI002FEE40F9